MATKPKAKTREKAVITIDKQAQEIKPYQKEVLAKSNVLIGAKYKASALENKITYIAMLKLQENDYREEADGLYVEMAAQELKEEIGARSGSFYSAIKDVANALTGNNIGIVDDENQTFVYLTLINKAEYSNGKFTVRFAAEAKKNVLNIKENFTLLPKNIAMSLRKPYSFPLYQLLKRYCYYPAYHKGERNNCFKVSIGLAELKLDIGVVNANSTEVKRMLSKTRGSQKDYEDAVAIAEQKGEAMFKSWGEFNRICLVPTLNEINNNSDIYVEYATSRSGRGGKVRAINFIVWIEDAAQAKKLENNDSESAATREILTDNNSSTEQDEEDFDAPVSKAQTLYAVASAGKELAKYNLSIEEIMSVCEAANYNIDRIINAKDCLDSTSAQVNNITGWLISAIKSGYKKVEKKASAKKKNAFNNIESREYDFDELEKRLISNNKPIKKTKGVKDAGGDTDDELPF